jgi:hypothetical protein
VEHFSDPGLDASAQMVPNPAQEPGETIIASDPQPQASAAATGLALLFAPGGRPGAPDVLRAAGQPRLARIAQVSSDRAAADGWLELLASGLTFDLVGLAPGSASPVPPPRHVYGLSAAAADAGLEAIGLVPGPHLAGVGGVVPVVRVMAGLAAALAVELGALALCWQPAASWMDARYFDRVVAAWVEGGGFPALGFAGMVREGAGAVRSEGLAWFAGQELVVDPRPAEPAAETVKLAVRMADWLVRHGPLTEREALTGPAGEALVAEPSADGCTVRLRREG